MKLTLLLVFLGGAMSAASAADRFYIDAVYIEPGETQTLALNLENEVPYYGFQADINLPKGLEFVIENGSPSIFLSSRANSSYSLVTNLLNLGSLRVGAFSSNHASITGSSGTLLFVKVIADDEFVGGELALSNIHFVGDNDRDIVFPNFTLNIRNKADNKCYLPDFSIAVSQTKTVSLILDNETPFTAFQTDVYLPDGFSIVADSFKATARATNHTISAKSFSDGRTRIICFSPSNSVITSGTGAILEFDIHVDRDTEETCTIELKNQTFSTSTAEEYVLPNSTSDVAVSGALVSDIILSESRAEMNIGETLTLTATVNPSHATNKNIKWTSSNPEVATVSSLGVVSAVGEGVAIITAKATDGSGVSASCVISVNGIPVTGIILTRTNASLKASETVQLNAIVNPANASNKSLIWSSGNNNVAIVNQDGLVTGVAIGETSITVTSASDPNVSAQCKITIIPTPVTSITLRSTSVQLKATETAKLEAQVAPADASDKSLTWTSSNTAVATVDANGNITAVSVGEADITATANDGSGVSATCKVTVIPTPVESVSVTANGSTTLKAGQTVQLNATVLPESATEKTVIWTSSNTDVDTVNNAGLVTAVAIGNASITATSGDKSSSVNITVEKTLAESIVLNRTTAAMKVSGTMQLSVVFTPETTTNKSVSWASSNPSIASVNDNGVVTAHALGDCRISVTTKDGSNVSAYCDVTVGETAAESISIEPKGPFTFKVGETVQLSATVLPETTTDKSVSWLAQTGAVKVDENGLVTALAVGTSWVSATNSAGQVDYVDFTVVPTPVTSITLSSTSVQLKATETAKLEAEVAPADATDKSLTWTSSNTAVATVDANGNITAVAVGEAVITATANDGSGVSATCKVTVVPTPVESVSITANGSTTLKEGQTVQLNATVLPETAMDKTVVWTSSNTAVATVNNAGLVTAVAVGNASIIATSGDKYANIDITVEAILAESLILYHTDIDLKVGEEYTLSPFITPTNVTNKTLSWTSDDESIASVDSNGTVHANAIGNTVVRVATTDGTNLSAEARIYVHPTPISQIVVDYDGPITLKVGQTVQLSARVLPETATDKSIKWMTQSGAILDISENGLVTAVGLGTAWAGAFADNESEYPYAVVEFTVVETPVERIGFEQDYITVRTGEQSQINAIIYPSTATNKILTWDSNDSNIATVDNNGVVTGVRPGQIDINARATDGSGVLNAIRVIVDEMPVESVSIDAQGTTKLKDGDTLQLVGNILPTNAYNQSLTWSSSDEEIATVSESGLVTAHAIIGRVAITATATNGVKGTLDIEVTETPVEAIELQCNPILKVGEFANIRAVVLPETATNKSVTWSVENAEILRIQDYYSSVLVVEAMHPGQSLVYATSNSGVVGSYPINVNPILAESIDLNQNSVKLNVSETFRLEATVLPENASDKSARWVSTNPQTVTVDENGLLTAIAPGTSDIIAYTNDGSELEAICFVEVVQPVTSIALSEHGLTLYSKETFTLVAIIEPIDATDKSVKWESSNEDVATVDNLGVITTDQDDIEGETAITVTTLDGSNLSDECVVTVKKNDSGVETIRMNDVDITVNSNQIIISELKNGVVARLFTLDGVLLGSVVGIGSDIIFEVAANTYYILNIGDFSLKVKG